jgi:hypothetical protein
MDHAMAVRAKQRKVFETRSLARAERVNWLGVVALDEPVAVLAIHRPEVESARLAGKIASVGQRSGLAAGNELGAALASNVLRGQ